MLTTRVLLALGVLSLFVAAAPQNPVPSLGERMEISIVNVDVFVTDKSGNRVHGLTKDDFEIFEGGRRQPLSNFAEYRSVLEAGAASVGGEGAVQAPPRQRRTIVVFLESIRLAPFQSAELIGAIKDVLRRTVASGDAVSLVVWNRYSTKHLAFTDDLDEIEAELDAYARSSTQIQLDEVGREREQVRGVRDFEAQVAARVAAAGMGGQGHTANIEQSTSGDSSRSVMLPMLTAWVEMKMRVAAINSTIHTMAAGDGKKILILGTHRLGSVAGAEFMYIGGASLLPDDARQRFDTSDMMKTIVDNANSSGVSIYPIYPEGLVTTLPDASVGPVGLPRGGETVNNGLSLAADNLTLLNETVNLSRIADKTGGLMAWSVKEIVQLMPEVASDMTDYYSLAYRVEPSGTDRIRDIVVKTKNRDLKVRARRQYVERSETTRMRDRLTSALFGGGAETSIGITATLGERRGSGKRSSIPVSIQVPIKSLTALPQAGEKLAGSFSVFVATAVDLDELSDFVQRTQPFEFAATDADRANAGHFTYDLDVVVGEKARYLAVGVLDEVSGAWGVTRLDLRPAHEPQNATR